MTLRTQSKTVHRRFLTLAAILAAAAFLLVRCGGNSPTTPPPTTPPTTLPPPEVVFNGNWHLPVNYAGGDYFTTTRPGTLDATINYTFATNQIVVWLARGRCTPNAFDAEQCDYAATSFAGSKPRKISVTGAAAGTYTLIVWNVGPDDEQIAFQVVLTSTAASSGVAAAMRPSTHPFRIPMPRP